MDEMGKGNLLKKRDAVVNTEKIVHMSGAYVPSYVNVLYVLYLHPPTPWHTPFTHTITGPPVTLLCR